MASDQQPTTGWDMPITQVRQLIDACHAVLARAREAADGK